MSSLPHLCKSHCPGNREVIGHWSLQIADCRLQIVNCRLQIVNCQLPIVNWITHQVIPTSAPLTERYKSSI